MILSLTGPQDPSLVKNCTILSMVYIHLYQFNTLQIYYTNMSVMTPPSFTTPLRMLYNITFACRLKLFPQKIFS